MAERLRPYEDRLAELVELGLRHVEGKTSDGEEVKNLRLKLRMLKALASMDNVTLPKPMPDGAVRVRRPPIKTTGPSASEMIIAQREALR